MSKLLVDIKGADTATKAAAAELRDAVLASLRDAYARGHLIPRHFEQVAEDTAVRIAAEVL